MLDVWINIDHHVTNDRYGDLDFIDAIAPATGQILFELFASQNLPLTYAMADNLFVAISTDTGSFQYPNTTARTYEIGAELINARRQCRRSFAEDVRELSAPPARTAARAAQCPALHQSRLACASFALTAETTNRRSARCPRTTRG